jgi:glycosyltransferase involved in cell wall biosynthesis
MSSPQRKTVAFLGGSSGDWGGASRVLFNTIKLLDRDRYEPVVLLPDEGPIRPTLDALGVRYLIWGRLREPTAGLLRYARDVGTAARFLREHRIDLLDVNMNYWRPAEILAARLMGVPIVTHYHVLVSSPGPFARFSSAIVVVSRFAAEHSQPKGARMEVIHNTVTLDRFDRARDIRSEIGVAASDTVVSFVGQIRENKGVDLFIRMARAIPDRDARFLIVGECRNPDRFPGSYTEARLDREIGGDSRIRYLGYRSDIENVFRSSDLLVMPSRWGEPFGLINIEAGAAGKPMIATRDGGIPEIILNGENGYLVDVDDLEGLTAYTRRLVGDRALREAMGRRARARVEAEFTTRPVRRLEQLYDELLSPRTRSRASMVGR